MRDPARWHQSVNNTIRQFEKFMCSWLALPMRCLLALKGGGSWVAADYTCTAPTYLGPRYPRGMFGAVDAGEETAVRFYNEWVEQVRAEIPAERLLVFDVKQVELQKRVRNDFAIMVSWLEVSTSAFTITL